MAKHCLKTEYFGEGEKYKQSELSCTRERTKNIRVPSVTANKLWEIMFCGWGKTRASSKQCFFSQRTTGGYKRLGGINETNC